MGGFGSRFFASEASALPFRFFFFFLAAFELEQIEALPGTFALRCLG